MRKTIYKLKAIWNILTNKPVMINTTFGFFEGEDPRMFDRLFLEENNDGIIDSNTFITIPDVREMNDD